MPAMDDLMKLKENNFTYNTLLRYTFNEMIQYIYTENCNTLLKQLKDI